MPTLFSDEDIEMLLQQPKSPLDATVVDLLPTRKATHQELNIPLAGPRSLRFHVILRRNTKNHYDFSAIIAVEPPTTRKLFRIRRYNGNSHGHSNRIEGDRVTGFHIHLATERYQEKGLKEDGFAMPTNRFEDFNGAITCLTQDANLHFPTHWGSLASRF